MKTTDKQFKQFQKLFNHYVGIFGLTRYRITFEHKDLDEFVYAEIMISEESGTASVRFNKIKQEKLDIKKTALHEALHLLHSGVMYLARERFVSSVEIRIAEEHVVNILEKVIGG